MPLVIIHGNDSFIKEEKLEAINKSASLKKYESFRYYASTESEEIINHLEDLKSYLTFGDQKYCLILEDPKIELLEPLLQIKDYSPKSFIVLYFGSTLKSNSRWLKKLKDIKEKKLFFYKKEPYYKNETQALDYSNGLLKYKGYTMSPTLLTYISKELDHKRELIKSELNKAFYFAEAQNKSELGLDIFKETFSRPLDRDFNCLLKEIESKNLKGLIRAVDSIYLQPPYDPTWPLCMFLNKVFQGWLNILNLHTQNTNPMFIARELGISDYIVRITLKNIYLWDIKGVIALMRGLFLTRRHLLEKGTNNDLVLKSQLVLAVRGDN